MKVIWSETVLGELGEIHDWLCETSSEGAAMRTIDGILGRGEQLGVFPESGRIVPDEKSPRSAEG
jgi:plasmid stabilization system protein ParE